MSQYLSHHGVKGMKWGVRKKRSKTSNPTSVNKAVKPEKKKMNEKTKARIKKGAIYTGVALATVGMCFVIPKFQNSMSNKLYKQWNRNEMRKREREEERQRREEEPYVNLSRHGMAYRRKDGSLVTDPREIEEQDLKMDASKEWLYNKLNLN